MISQFKMENLYNLDDDLSEFHAIMSGNNPQEHDDDSTAANSLQQELDFDSSEETDTKSAISTFSFVITDRKELLVLWKSNLFWVVKFVQFC